MMDLLRRLLFLPPAASSVADGVDALDFVVFALTLATAFYVFATTAWLIVRHPRRSQAQLTPAVGASAFGETIVVSVVTVTFVALWVVGFRQYLSIQSAPADAEVVVVDAKQWMWKFESAGRASNDVLTVPVDRPIKLVMTSRDVIHSFYVPAFRLKQDVVPGRTTTLWFRATVPGTYPIYCAEYCGVSHSRMSGAIVVLSADDYARFRGSAFGSWADRGREVAAKRGCLACHTLDGQRHVGPSWRGAYGAERTLADGRRIVVDDDYLTRSMIEPNADVVEGYRPIMPTYRGVLTPAETGSLVALIKALRDEPGSAPGVTLPALDGGSPP